MRKSLSQPLATNRIKRLRNSPNHFEGFVFKAMCINFSFGRLLLLYFNGSAIFDRKTY